MQEIQEILERLAAARSSNSGLQDFETVEIPFQLTRACFQLWTDCFPPEMLQELDRNDPETLEAWAIALNATLQVQLGLLNQWLPFLSTLSLPVKLREKAARRTEELDHIAREKLVLLQTSPQLLEKETELQNAAAELEALRVKMAELQSLEAEVKAVDLEALEAEVRQQENDWLPQQQRLEELQQQKSALDAKISTFNRQQEILEGEIERQKSNLENCQLEQMNRIETLLLLAESAKAELSDRAVEALDNLERQRNTYNSQWQEWQQTLSAGDRYLDETEAIRAELAAHYQSDADLGERLPVERQKLESLVQSLQESLAELDRELKTAHARHERSQQKQYITF